jgi:hypothetical protein
VIDPIPGSATLAQISLTSERASLPARSATTSPAAASSSLGGQVYDPKDPMGKMFFDILATFAEFEVDLLRMRIQQQRAPAARSAMCPAR